jgi:hypothetical protein
VLLLPDAGVAGATSIPDPSGEDGSEFGAALAVLESFDGRHDTLVVGAPGATVMEQPGSGKIFVYSKSFIARANDDTATVPELLAEYPSPGTAYRPGTVKGERLGDALLGFTSREEGAAQEDYWLAAGTPEKSEDGTRCGGVELFRVNLETGLRSEIDLSPPRCEAGMKFGDALAVSRGQCDDNLCPRNRAWIAVGSPQEDDGAGRVRLWNVWESGEAGDRIEDTWKGVSADALFGKQLTSLRAREKGGGFLVSSKRGELPLVGPRGAVSQVESGYVQVHLNTQGASEWTSWVKGYGPASTADTPPDNR